MSKLLQLFTLSGAFFGILLYYAPEMFHGVAVQHWPHPEDVSRVLNNKQRTESRADSATNEKPFKKVISLTLSGQLFTIPLHSYDKSTIANAAREFCLANAASLSITDDALERGCIQPVTHHLFNQVYTDKMAEYIVEVMIPINDLGDFEVQFDILSTSLHTVASNFCHSKKEILGLAPDVSAEYFEAHCIVPVANYIQNNLQERGVLGADDEVVPEEEREAAQEQQREAQQSVPVEHGSAGAAQEQEQEVPVTEEQQPVAEEAVDEVGAAILAAEPSSPAVVPALAPTDVQEIVPAVEE